MNPIALFVAGLTDSYNPCSIGVLLVSLTFLVGLGKRKLISIFGLSYLSLIFLTYFLIGLGVLRAFHIFGIHGFFAYAAGIVLIVVAIIHVLPMYLKRMPIFAWFNRCHIPARLDQHLDKGVFIAGAILGFLMGLCTVPCAGGIYMGAIALVSASMTFWQGVAGIFIFNVGFILPLAIIFVLASRKTMLEKMKKINVRITAYSPYIISVIMILMGLALIYTAKM